jgi:hypothetical protein
MFNRLKDKAWNEGSEWGLDTFAYTVEMQMIMGYSLEEAYDFAKRTMVNAANLQSRLTAFKEYHV